MAARAAAMLAHAARDEPRRRVLQHLRIAAQHYVRRFSGELQPGRLLQAPIADRRRYTSGERIRRLLAAHECHIADPRLPNDFLVCELARIADRVHQHDVAKATPQRFGPQDGYEWRQPGPCGDEPERLGIRHLGERQEPRRVSRYMEGSAGPDLRQPPREGPPPHDRAGELEHRGLRRIDEREGKGDPFTIDIERDAHELPGLEAEM